MPCLMRYRASDEARAVVQRPRIEPDLRAASVGSGQEISEKCQSANGLKLPNDARVQGGG